MSIAPLPDFDAALRDRFGLHRFRPGQREVIEQVCQGRDVLCVMPTGGGKSLCYQLPALVMDGLTVVVSPLIALMKDQVDALHQRGVAATLLNSSLDPEEQRIRLQEIEAGRYNLVYVAPERFRSPRFVSAMARIKPVLLAVDEAHCISEWGHDFRPDYARIGIARRELGSPPCIALTATATDLVRRDIADQLDLRDPAQFVTGFDRPNLHYGVIEARREEDKLAALARTLDEHPGAAVVYASSRDRCRAVGHYLETELRRSVVVYHAGLQREERAEAQDRFMSGDAEIVVATNAFGMGVDKPDIRAVIHFNLPGTIEAYYQEAGRAGRDGDDAACVLLYSPGDRRLQELFIENEYPTRDSVHSIYNFLCTLDHEPIELTHQEIKELARSDLGDSAIGSCLKILEHAGAIERFLPRENMGIVRINRKPDDPPFSALLGRAHVQKIVMIGVEGLVGDKLGEPIYFHPDEFATALGLDRAALTRALKAISSEHALDYVPPFRGNAIRVTDRRKRARDLEIDFATQDQRRRREFDKLDKMIDYATSGGCRRATILSYFGDKSASRCGHCDNCSGQRTGTSRATLEVSDEGVREVLLKALSGVARAKGRFGKTMVAQMLAGSRSEKVAKTGLDRLSTFGILNNFRQPELMLLLDALTRAKLVESVEIDKFRPIISISDAGMRFLKEPPDRPLNLDLDSDLAAKIRLMDRSRPTGQSVSTPSPGQAPAEPDPLREKLRTMRLTISRAEDRPAHHVFTDETLGELVRIRPSTPAELLAVKGMGPSRVERYGRTILDAIGGESAPATFASPPAEPRRSEAPAPLADYINTEEWTWRLFDRGFTASEAAAIRGLDFAAIVRHATIVVRAGKPVDPALLIDDQTLTRWRELRAQGLTSRPHDDNGRDDLWSFFLAAENPAE